MGYLRTTVKGTSWIGSLKLLSRIFSIIRTMIIARILTPSQFGVFGIAALALSLTEVFTETGINVVLVQKKENIDEYINTAWIISIIRGFLIFLVIFLSAGFVANFFKTEEALDLLRLIAFVPLVRGFINPSVAKFQKELKFNMEFYYRTSILILETSVSIALVIITKNPIALVWGMICGAIFEVILSFFIIKPTPVLNINGKIFRDIISHSKWITSSGIFSYLFSSGDNVVVGRTLGTSSLGIYDMAYSIAMLPTSEISEVVSRVTFPVYVQISDDKKRLKKAFLRTTGLVALTVTPIVLVFLLFPTQIITIFLGNQWLGAAAILQILSIFALVVAVFSPVGALFLSIKKQNYNFVISVVSFTVMITLIYPFILQWGLVGAGLAATIGAIAPIPLVMIYLRRIFKS